MDWWKETVSILPKLSEEEGGTSDLNERAWNRRESVQRRRLLWGRLCAMYGCASQSKPSSRFFMCACSDNYGQIPFWTRRRIQYICYEEIEFSLRCQRCHSPINIDWEPQALGDDLVLFIPFLNSWFHSSVYSREERWVTKLRVIAYREYNCPMLTICLQWSKK